MEQVSLDVVVPVLNEAHVLEQSVTTLRQFLRQSMRCSWRLIVVDNGSTDATLSIARKLSAQFPDTVWASLPLRGRGRAVRHAWLSSTADVVCYMDVDLSTDLSALPALVAAIAEQGYDFAVGSRLRKDSRVRRSLKREILSRGYNLLVKAMFPVRFSDAQCGFKAANRKAAQAIVPQVQDQHWFFDTEMLVLAEKQGYRIKDLPVTWIEDHDSRVKLLATAWDDLKGLFRLRRALSKNKSPLPASVRSGVPEQGQL